MSNRGLHKPMSESALAMMGCMRNHYRMARTYHRPGRGWYIDYIDAGGRRHRLRGGDTQKEAEVMLTMRTMRQAYVRAGMADAKQVKVVEHGERPIEVHRKAWLAAMAGRKCSEKHIRESERCVKAWCQACEIERLNDIDSVRTEVWLADLVKSGRSARTRNAYLVRAKEFCNWCEVNGRLSISPLKPLKMLNEAADRVRPSRAMTPQQFQQLLDATPAPRRLYYMLAGRMGLRWVEIARLRREQFVDGYLILHAGGTKNRRGAELPVPDAVWEEVMQMRIGRLFDAPPTLVTWKKDLVRAGLVKLANKRVKNTCRRLAVENLKGYVTEAGQLDRKSLRKTFGTFLAVAGVDLRIAQRLMRHSTPALTSNIYTDPVLLDMKAATNAANAPVAGKKASVA